MQILITEYTINPRANTVSGSYCYDIDDAVTGEAVERGGVFTLSQTVAPLDTAGWSDSDLAAAVAKSLQQDVKLVAVAEPTVK